MNLLSIFSSLISPDGLKGFGLDCFRPFDETQEDPEPNVFKDFEEIQG
jgi:hypothetical protein